ncbi:uncharacterized protein LAESUDRAFT_413824 [Laetiporus sulphureus 93-53]|uniref:Uncharacterized protein n=1 Tax=Laetiporus sulphureus 93-53 TaxID=1314785 RepID=A0A165C7V0_9APHY|nr:uncharacterized protein LAESUDRAFT_413824 [Laetiporus sulphureus 93-53]KZT02351.1 hypothetical protein LAESUDRAFT_413824 [Laetiporus sulphureus 93-53]
MAAASLGANDRLVSVEGVCDAVTVPPLVVEDVKLVEVVEMIEDEGDVVSSVEVVAEVVERLVALEQTVPKSVAVA